MNQLFLFKALLQEPAPSLELSSPLLLLRSPLPPRAVEALARRTIGALGRHDVVEADRLLHTLNFRASRTHDPRACLVIRGSSDAAGVRRPVCGLEPRRHEAPPRNRLAHRARASTHDIRMMVICEALVTAAARLVLGVPFAFACGRLIA